MNPTGHISLIEDDPETRAVCREILEAAGWVCREYGSEAEVHGALRRDQLGDMALVDLDLDGKAAFALIRRIRAAAPEVHLVALTAHSSDEWLFPALAAGCTGFVLKSEAVRRLPEVAALALRGEAPLTGSIARRVLSRFHSEPNDRPALSPRETEVLRLLAQGMTYETAATTLGLSLSTLRTHVQHIYEKLDVTNKAQAATEAIRRGLVR